MKRWQPEFLYRLKPWALIGIGAVAGIGAMSWSWFEGSWTPLRSLCCFMGSTLAIGGGAILQLRQNYRIRSKWRRAQLRDK